MLTKPSFGFLAFQTFRHSRFQATTWPMARISIPTHCRAKGKRVLAGRDTSSSTRGFIAKENLPVNSIGSKEDEEEVVPRPGIGYKHPAPFRSSPLKQVVAVPVNSSIVEEEEISRRPGIGFKHLQPSPLEQTVVLPINSTVAEVVPEEENIARPGIGYKRPVLFRPLPLQQVAIPANSSIVEEEEVSQRPGTGYQHTQPSPLNETVVVSVNSTVAEEEPEEPPRRPGIGYKHPAPFRPSPLKQVLARQELSSDSTAGGLISGPSKTVEPTSEPETNCTTKSYTNADAAPADGLLPLEPIYKPALPPFSQAFLQLSVCDSFFPLEASCDPTPTILPSLGETVKISLFVASLDAIYTQHMKKYTATPLQSADRGHKSALPDILHQHMIPPPPPLGLTDIALLSIDKCLIQVRIEQEKPQRVTTGRM